MRVAAYHHVYFVQSANGILQRLGECLGKGAFGSVYKAFNWGTGEAVAVKQIRLADLPKSELRMIEVRSALHQALVTYADCRAS